MEENLPVINKRIEVRKKTRLGSSLERPSLNKNNKNLYFLLTF